MRRRGWQFFASACGAVLATALAGCATSTAPLRRVDVPALATLLRSRLARDARLTTSAGVDVNAATGVVTLFGEVANAEEREAAGRIVSSVSGVSMVYNELEIRRAPR